MATQNTLALLFAGPWHGEEAMHHDLRAVHDALRARGLRSEETLLLAGRLSRGVLLGCVAAVRARWAGWAEGDLFLYYSGHGGYAPLDAADAAGAEPALVFAEEDLAEPSRWLPWRELFAALALPPGVRLSLLPDC